LLDSWQVRSTHRYRRAKAGGRLRRVIVHHDCGLGRRIRVHDCGLLLWVYCHRCERRGYDTTAGATGGTTTDQTVCVGRRSAGVVCWTAPETFSFVDLPEDVTYQLGWPMFEQLTDAEEGQKLVPPCAVTWPPFGLTRYTAPLNGALFVSCCGTASAFAIGSAMP
jgi:hypothetical protein